MKDPDPSFQPVHGQIETLEPGIRRIVAPNPSPMTFRGTNTFVLGEKELAVVDPGPISDPHLDAILQTISNATPLKYILVTHAHLDHSPLAARLSEMTGAPIVAFGDAQAGRSDIMQELAQSQQIGGGEGVDVSFKPDVIVDHDTTLDLDGAKIDILHTPGHFGNHISIGFNRALLSGDLVMGWATTLISPPDGDLTDFRNSCNMLLARDWNSFHPSHGAPLTAPNDRLEELLAHRNMRENQILDRLQGAPQTAKSIAAAIYTETPAALLPAAERNVMAHLIDLTRRKVIEHEGNLHVASGFKAI